VQAAHAAKPLFAPEVRRFCPVGTARRSRKSRDNVVLPSIPLTPPQV
jgi:hypothetical protein